jgi:hydroxymethylbilane synthase
VSERPLRLGTRGSALALAQAGLVAKALGDAEIVPIRTSNGGSPKAAEGPGPTGGDKARFVREIERALLEGEVDLGVHSAKDLPTELPDQLEIVGVPERAEPADAYVGGAGSLEDVPEGARVGTSSLRRRAQLLALRPDLGIADLRGNVDTRLSRLAAGDFDGLVLAAAGLRRLDRGDEIAFILDPGQLTPAPGQGALAIEARRSDERACAVAESITDRGALGRLAAERSLVAALEASCNTPLGALATLEPGGRMRLRAFCGLPDGSEWLRDELEEDASDPEGLGRRLAERMISAGAAEILARSSTMGRSSTSRRGPPEVAA